MNVKISNSLIIAVLIGLLSSCKSEPPKDIEPTPRPPTVVIDDTAKKEEEVTPIDTDGDGVVDSSDLCPDHDDTKDANSNGIPDWCDLTPNAVVVARQIFYNRSSSTNFGNGSGNPESAIDSSKVALLPGEVSSFANYTNYVKGINGILVDLEGNTGRITRDDFIFSTWDGKSAAAFVTLNGVEASVSEIPGAGLSGSKRIKIEFADLAVKNTWLRVIVKANNNTRLINEDKFYFGNAIADVNANNSGTPIKVRTTAIDTAVIRGNQSSSVPVSNIYDINKDGAVNDTDTELCRQNQNLSIFYFFTAALIDVCGKENGDGTSCLDCAGIPFGSSAMDVCNVCNGDGTSCLDCNGLVNGSSVLDRCDICDGDGSSCPGNNLETIRSHVMSSTLNAVEAPGASMNVFSMYGGESGTYVSNPNRLLANVDITSIPVWRQNVGILYSGILVTPRHLVFANHVGYAPNEKVVFRGSDGVLYNRNVVHVYNATLGNYDLGVASLDSDLPSVVTPARMLPNDAHRWLTSSVISTGIPVVSSNQQRKLIVRKYFENQKYGTYLNTPYFYVAAGSYLEGPFQPFSIEIIGGDSGSPTFMILNGEAVVLNVFWGASGGTALHSVRSLIDSSIQFLGGTGYPTGVVDLSGFRTETLH